MSLRSILGIDCCVSRERKDAPPSLLPVDHDEDIKVGFLPAATEKLVSPVDLVEDERRSRAVLTRHREATATEASLLAYWIEEPEKNTRGSSSTQNKLQRNSVASLIPQNAPAPIPVESSGFVGHVLWMQRTTPDACYHSHFARRRRNWELRLQGRFKRVPVGRIYSGIVLRDFNYNQAVARMSQVVKSAGLKLMPFDDAYVCWGDRCKEAEKPDAEYSHLVAELAGWDQIIVTEPGKEPPDIQGELKYLGLEREALGVSAYSKKVQEEFADIRTDTTYTFAFWGCSRYVDILNWQFSLGWKVDMKTFFQEWPMHAVMYELDPMEVEEDGRHLESRKKYVLDMMFWNSLNEIHDSLPERYNFKDPNRSTCRPPALTADSIQGGGIDRISSRDFVTPINSETPQAGADGVHRSRSNSWLPRWLSRTVCGASGASGDGRCLQVPTMRRESTSSRTLRWIVCFLAVFC